MTSQRASPTGVASAKYTAVCLGRQRRLSKHIPFSSEKHYKGCLQSLEIYLFLFLTLFFSVFVSYNTGWAGGQRSNVVFYAQSASVVISRQWYQRNKHSRQTNDKTIFFSTRNMHSSAIWMMKNKLKLNEQKTAGLLVEYHLGHTLFQLTAFHSVKRPFRSPTWWKLLEWL